LRPPPQRPQSTLEIGSSATLPLRPLSSNVDMTTGDLIYDKLPETLPRPPKSHPSTVTVSHTTACPLGVVASLQFKEMISVLNSY
jgi:hypothetical protein